MEGILLLVAYVEILAQLDLHAQLLQFMLDLVRVLLIEIHLVTEGLRTTHKRDIMIRVLGLDFTRQFNGNGTTADQQD